MITDVQLAIFTAVPAAPPSLLVFLCYLVAVNNSRSRNEGAAFSAPGTQNIAHYVLSRWRLRGAHHSIQVLMSPGFYQTPCLP
uniref:Uncharacterized protein n=1 Tax=Mus spicilegus TaxID=10103 RepID=A0A8C6HJF3_MUSSI